MLDLSGRNRLLYFQRGSSTRIQLERPAPEELFASLALEERSLSFPRPRGLSIDEIELGDGPDDQIAIVPGEIDTSPPVGGLEELRNLYRKLERLRRVNRTIYEEQGVHTLFLALGLLEWKEAEDSKSLIQSPLVLVPVRLELEHDAFRLLPHEDDVEVNPALAYRLQRDFGLVLPGIEWNEQQRVADGAFQQFLDVVRDLVQRRGWVVLEQAWLALFQYYKLPMYRDLEAPDVPSTAAAHPIVSALCGLREGRPYEPIDIAGAEEAYTRPDLFPVLDCDSSQLEVMEQVRRGKTLVVQGHREQARVKRS
ncbi:MAG: DUF4011 domain-containing protein [Firmicutes bacterium]|nr:DUF4011 domain-containing protein [Bacillota bacterium]